MFKMRNVFLILSASILFIGCNRDPLVPIAEQKNYYNHEIFEENKLAPRATYFGFESVAILEKKNSKRFIDLNGDWKFNFTKDPKERPTTFQNVHFDDSEWKTIPVPANWEVEGYDYPIYLDERYPFKPSGQRLQTIITPWARIVRKLTLRRSF